MCAESYQKNCLDVGSLTAQWTDATAYGKWNLFLVQLFTYCHSNNHHSSVSNHYSHWQIYVIVVCPVRKLSMVLLMDCEREVWQGANKEQNMYASCGFKLPSPVEVEFLMMFWQMTDDLWFYWVCYDINIWLIFLFVAQEEAETVFVQYLLCTAPLRIFIKHGRSTLNDQNLTI